MQIAALLAERKADKCAAGEAVAVITRKDKYFYLSSLDLIDSKSGLTYTIVLVSVIDRRWPVFVVDQYLVRTTDVEAVVTN